MAGMIVMRYIPGKGERPCPTAGPKTHSLPASTYMLRIGGARHADASSPCAIIAIAACSPSMAPCMSSVGWPTVPNGGARPARRPSARKPRRPWPCPGGCSAGTWCVGWDSVASPATGQWANSARSWLIRTRFTCLTMPLIVTCAATNRCWPLASATRSSWQPRMRTWTL